MKKILTSAVVAAALSISASAAGMNQANTGNYLVSPAYFAMDGYESKLEIMNTRDNVAIVAKVVIREGDCSQELLDFLVFLSPGDAFNATIKQDGKDSDGNPIIKIFSEDDSLDPDAIEYSKFRKAQGGQPIIKADGVLKEAYYVDGVHPINGTDEEKYKGVRVTGNNGYIEVFTLLEMNPYAIDKDWEIETPLSKKKMYDFYMNYETMVEKNVSVTYGSSGKLFTDANVTDALYDTAFTNLADQNVTGVDGTVREVLTATKYNEATKAFKPAANNDTIDEDLITGTLSLVNENTNQAMSVSMYAYNFDTIDNSVLGEQSAETNYKRVFGHDYVKANAALKQLADGMNKRQVFIPYTRGYGSELNMLFLAKNLSNHKCKFNRNETTKVWPVRREMQTEADFNAAKSAGTVFIKTMSPQVVPYSATVRDMAENVAHVKATKDPLSGGVTLTELSGMQAELSQIHISDVIKDKLAEASQGWVTINIIDNEKSDFAYDVNESKIADRENSPIGTPEEYNSSVPGLAYKYPVLLPSYMQILPVGENKAFTNLFIPANKKGN